jgi:hypothetical protein
MVGAGTRISTVDFGGRGEGIDTQKHRIILDVSAKSKRTKMQSDLSKYELMFVIDESFNITARGVAIVSPHDCELKHPIKSGDAVVLKLPDGHLFNSIAYVEMLCPNTYNVVALLLPGLTKDHLPAGTEVWSLMPEYLK